MTRSLFNTWFDGVENRSVAIVVAHQDDETIFASVLTRCPHALVVHITDGGPEDPGDWKEYKTRDAYVSARRAELTAALDAAGHIGPRVTLGVTDMQAAWNMVPITACLSGLFELHHTRVVFTHAYEGGHPDHDTAAFTVHLACSEILLSLVIEAPAYRMDGESFVWQKFIPIPGVKEATLHLTAGEQHLKRKMFAAHVSQRDIVAELSPDTEYFREVRETNFNKPPNGGNLGNVYARAGLDARKWNALMTDAHLENLIED